MLFLIMSKCNCTTGMWFYQMLKTARHGKKKIGFCAVRTLSDDYLCPPECTNQAQHKPSAISPV